MIFYVILQIVMIVICIIIMISYFFTACDIEKANRNFKKNLPVFTNHILDNYPGQIMIYSTFCNINTTLGKARPLLIWITFTSDYLVMAVRSSDTECDLIHFLAAKRDDISFKREILVGLKMKFKLLIDESEMYEGCEENKEKTFYLRINKKTRKEILSVAEYNKIMEI